MELIISGWENFLDVLNDNTGVTLIISAIGFGFNEFLKTRNAKKMLKYSARSEQIDPETYKTEQGLYQMISKIYATFLSNETNDYSAFSTEIRDYVINNDLHIREKISTLGVQYADYLLEASVKGRNPKTEKNILKNIKKEYRA